MTHVGRPYRHPSHLAKNVSREQVLALGAPEKATSAEVDGLGGRLGAGGEGAVVGTTKKRTVVRPAELLLLKIYDPVSNPRAGPQQELPKDVVKEGRASL